MIAPSANNNPSSMPVTGAGPVTPCGISAGSNNLNNNGQPPTGSGSGSGVMPQSGTKSLIIQKDERGFGLKVSGSHPVFVAHVTEGGAAARAGVHVGDRIIKVNGNLVTKSDHNIVVQMIKSSGGQYVALTVIPAATPSNPSSPGLIGPATSSPLNSSSCPQSNPSSPNQNTVQLGSPGNLVMPHANNPLHPDDLMAPRPHTLIGIRSLSPQPPILTLHSMHDHPLHPSVTSPSTTSPSSHGQSDVTSPSASSSSRPPLINRSVSASSSMSHLQHQNLGSNYYRSGNHQPLIPTHLSESRTVASSSSTSSLAPLLGAGAASGITNPNVCSPSSSNTSSSGGGTSNSTGVDITSPIPADPITLMECEKTREKTIRAMIKQEKELLAKLPGSDEAGAEATKVRLTTLKKQLKLIQRCRNRLLSKNIFSPNHLMSMSSSQTHLLAPDFASTRDLSGSTDDLHHGITNPLSLSHPNAASFWGTTTSSSSGTGQGSATVSHSTSAGIKVHHKSHSFKDELLPKSKEPILSMESDEEGGDTEEDGTTGSRPYEADESDNLAKTLKSSLGLKVGKGGKGSSDPSDEDIKDVASLFENLLNHKHKVVSDLLSPSNSSGSPSGTSGASSTTGKSTKEKITGRRKGPSAVRASFMSSMSPEEVDWMKESRRLLTLLSFCMNQRLDLNGLLFYGLGSLVQRELEIRSPSNCKGRKEALFEVISLFLLPDSPLLVDAARTITQSQLDALTQSLSPGVTNSVQTDFLAPYLNATRDSVNRSLVHAMSQTRQLGLLHTVVHQTTSGSVVSSSGSGGSSSQDKKRLKELMRRLLSDALSFEPNTPPNNNPFQATGSHSVPTPNSAPGPDTELNLFPSSAQLVANLKRLMEGHPLKDPTESIAYSHTVARVFSLLSLFYHILPHAIFFASSAASVYSDLEQYLLLQHFVLSRPGSGGGGADSGSASLTPRHKSLPSSLGPSATQPIGSNATIVDQRGTGTAIAGSSGVGGGIVDSSRIAGATMGSGVMIPSVTNITGGGRGKKGGKGSTVPFNSNHNMQGTPLNLLTQISYCTSCGHLLWGKSMFAMTCIRCKLTSHCWCFYTNVQSSVSSYPCLPPEPSFPPFGSLTSKSGQMSSLPTPPQLGLPLNLASSGKSEGRRSFFKSEVFSFNKNNKSLASTQDLNKGHLEDRSSMFGHPGDDSSDFNDSSSSSSSSDWDDDPDPLNLLLFGTQPERKDHQAIDGPHQDKESQDENEANELDEEEDDDLEDDEEDDYVSASSDPSTPILSSKTSRKKMISKNQRSKSLEEGAVTVAIEPTGGQSKEFEQLMEDRDRERQIQKDKRRRKLKQRKLNVMEFIKTERSFGKKLQLLNDLFYEPSTRLNVLTREEANMVFRNLPDIIKLHVRFYDQLKTRVRPLLMSGKRSAIDYVLIGHTLRDIFTQISPKLEEEHSYFSSRHLEALELLRIKCKSKNFSTFVGDAEAMPVLSRSDLKSLLAMPFQTIMRYPLLMSVVLESFVKPSLDPLDMANTNPKQREFLKREKEGREAFELTVMDIKKTIQGVNQRKTEYEFLSWFKHKLIPFYPRANLLTIDSVKVIHEGEGVWRISNRVAIDCYLILMHDLLLILTSDKPPPDPNAPNPNPSLSTSSSTTSSSLSLLPPTIVSQATSPASSFAASGSGSTGSFTFSFLSKSLQDIESARSCSYLLKGPEEKITAVTLSPVLEITTDLETRPVALNRTAFFLFSKGIPSTGSGKGSGKDVGIGAAMYELATGSDVDKDGWMVTIHDLVQMKKNGVKPQLTKGVGGKMPSTAPVHLHGSSNPFLYSKDLMEGITTNDQIGSASQRSAPNKNRPLPPLPSSASTQQLMVTPQQQQMLGIEANIERMKRSRSHEGGGKGSSLVQQPDQIQGDTNHLHHHQHHHHPQHASHMQYQHQHHPGVDKGTSDQDNLPPVVGRIERVTDKEPLKHYNNAVNIMSPPDVRFAQRIHVKSGFYDGTGSGVDGTEMYEDIRVEDQVEEALNQKILYLMEERRKYIVMRNQRTGNEGGSGTPTTTTGANIDLLGLAIDAFRLELLSSAQSAPTVDPVAMANVSPSSTNSSTASSSSFQNEINELRHRLLQSLNITK